MKLYAVSLIGLSISIGTNVHASFQPTVGVSTYLTVTSVQPNPDVGVMITYNNDSGGLKPTDTKSTVAAPFQISHKDAKNNIDWSIFSFCTDVGATASSDYFTPQTFDGLPNGTGVPNWKNQPYAIQNAAWLYNQEYAYAFEGFNPSVNNTVTDARTAGLQIAIWEVLNDSLAANSTFSLTDGNFKVVGWKYNGIKDDPTALAAKTYAEQYLAELTVGRASADFEKYNYGWLEPDGATHQGFLLPVPEPSTYLSAMLLGLPLGAQMLRMCRRKIS